MRDVEHGLLRALDVPDSTPYSKYIHSWRDQVSKWSFDDVPENIRGNSPPLHPSLVNTPFAFYDPIPVTMPVARPKSQSTSYKPKSISDILTPKSIHAITEWLEAYRQELARYDCPLGRLEIEIGLLSDMHFNADSRRFFCMGGDAHHNGRKTNAFFIRRHTCATYFIPHIPPAESYALPARACVSRVTRERAPCWMTRRDHQHFVSTSCSCSALT